MWRVSEDKPQVIAETSKYISFKWSPYGNYIAYDCFERGKDTTRELFVASVSDGVPKKLIERGPGSGLSRDWAWSPSGEKLAALADRKLLIFQMPDCEPHQVGKLFDPNWCACSDMEWSPDGRELAVIISMGPGSSGQQASRILTVTVPEGKWREVAGKAGTNYYLYWSPDGKWISYDSEEFVKVRPEGILWEVEIGEYLERMAEEHQDDSGDPGH